MPTIFEGLGIPPIPDEILHEQSKIIFAAIFHPEVNKSDTINALIELSGAEPTEQVKRLAVLALSSGMCIGDYFAKQK